MNTPERRVDSVVLAAAAAAMLFAAATPVVASRAAPAPASSIALMAQDITTGGIVSPAPITANAGDTIRYVIEYRNTGDASATDVIVTDTLPPAALATYNGDCSTCAHDAGSGTLTWSLGAQGPSAIATATFTATLSAAPPPGLTHVVDSVVQTSTGEPSHTASLNVDVTGSTSSILKEQADVTSGGAFTHSAITAQPGDTIRYRLTYTNLSSNPPCACGPPQLVVVTDTLPSASLATYGGDGSSGAVYDSTARTLTWTQTIANPGASAVFTYSVKLASTFAPGSTTAVPNTVVETQTGDIKSHTDSVMASVSATPAVVATRAPVPSTGAGDMALGPARGWALLTFGALLVALGMGLRRRSLG